MTSKYALQMNVHEFGLCVCVYIISMKKGQVVSIGRTLPPECPFQTYADLQKHWNSMVYKHTHVNMRTIQAGLDPTCCCFLNKHKLCFIREVESP